ncbi:MAG: metallopeptidase [Thermoprotei archaeon]|nr:MAG: metallopeptidase [Thermoprotei archaeon]
MGKIEYKEAVEIYPIFKELCSAPGLDHIKLERIKVYYSFGTKTTSAARIYGIPKILQIAYNIEPAYAIEIVYENFSKLSWEDKIKVLIHELLHIPRTFSGALRPHGRYITSEIIDELYDRFSRKKSSIK